MSERVYVIARSFFATGFGGVLEVRERSRIIRDLGYQVIVVHGYPAQVPQIIDQLGDGIEYMGLFAFFDQSLSRHRSLSRTCSYWKQRQLLWRSIKSAKPAAVMIHGERPLRFYLALQKITKTYFFRHDSAAASNGTFRSQLCDVWFKNETSLRKTILVLRRMYEARRFCQFKRFVANSRYIARIHGVPNSIIQPPPLIPVVPSFDSGVASPRDHHRITFAGRIEHAKGAHDAVKLMKILPDCYSIDFYGDGELRESLMKEVSLSELAGRLRFHGQSSPGTVRKAMSASGLTLIPSLVDEAMPLTAIESLSCGTPVAGYSVGGLPELIFEPVGLTVRPGDVDALAIAVRAICDNSEEWQTRSTAAIVKSNAMSSENAFRNTIQKMLL